MEVRTNVPRPRLSHYPIGAVIQLPNDTRRLTITEFRKDGYVDLFNGKYLSVTAWREHEVQK
jgi:hypothetical protein